MEPTKDMIEGIGWNSLEPGAPLFQRCVLELLSLIGVVLLEIRDRLPARTQQQETEG